MTNPIRIKRRSSGGAVGAPASLLSAEPAFNEVSTDLNLYYGYGDNGSGVATSVIVIGGFGSVFDTKVRAYRLDQFASATGPISGVDPTLPAHLSTKNYVDNAVQGLSAKASVQYTSNGPLTTNTFSGNVLTASANGALTVDGGSPATGNRVLVKDEATQANNGLYTVTNAGSGSTAWTLTRTTDMNTWANVPGAFVFTELGTANAEAGWVCASAPGGTLNSTAITFVQFSSAGIITAAPNGGLSKTGSALSVVPDVGISVSSSGVRISATYAGQSSITTLGTIATGVWQGTGVALGYGGTGANLSGTADGSIYKKSGTAFVVATAGTDYLNSSSVVDGGTF